MTSTLEKASRVRRRLRETAHELVARVEKFIGERGPSGVLVLTGPRWCVVGRPRWVQL